MDDRRLLADFNTLLRSRRQQLGLTQQALADLATLSVRAVRDLESGRVEHPRSDTVTFLADALRLQGRPRLVFEAAARPNISLLDEPKIGRASCRERV